MVAMVTSHSPAAAVHVAAVPVLIVFHRIQTGERPASGTEGEGKEWEEGEAGRGGGGGGSEEGTQKLAKC